MLLLSCLLLSLLHLLLTHLILFDDLGLLQVLLRRLLGGLAPIDMGMKHGRNSHPMRRVDREDVVGPISA